MILTIKSLHIVTMVAWFAAMFYLPRLFVYHVQTPHKEVASTLALMEHRLYRGIMTPAALLTLAFGIWLTVLNWSTYHVALWFWLKMVCVLGLFAFHGMCGSMVRKFQNEANERSHVFYRIFNEVPLLFLLIIVFLAIFKPSF